jgi:heme-degrading monooxygenase HmoA
MIARIWHGQVQTMKATEYRSFLNKQAIPDYGSVEGNHGVYIFEKQENERTHFLTLSFWSDKDAIEKFTGSNWKQAKYYAEDTNYLIEFEPNATHYRIVGKSWW